MSSNHYKAVTGNEKKRLLRAVNVANGVLISTTTKPGAKPWKVGVWHTGGKKYIYEFFDTEEEVILHAQKKVASFRGKSTVPGAVLLEDIRERFMLSRVNAGGIQLYQYGVLFDRLSRKGITDLRSPTLVSDTIRALEELALGAPATDERRKQLPWSASTWNTYLGLIKAIGNWCKMRSNNFDLDYNVFEDLKKKAADVYTPVIYRVEHQRLLVQPKNLDTQIGRFLVILLYTGMRANECRWLKWSNFDWAVGVVRVTHADERDVSTMRRLGIKTDRKSKDTRQKGIKTQEERAIPLEPELVALLKPWIGTGSDYLFSSDFLKMQTKQFIDRANQLFDALGIPRRGDTLHMFRHTYACVLDGAGVLRTDLKRRLGHSPHEDTIEDYLKAAGDVQQEVKGWGGRFRLAGCNRGVTTGAFCGQAGAPCEVVFDALQFVVSTENAVKYDENLQKYGENATETKGPIVMFPILQTGVRFPSPAQVISDEEIVIWDDEKSVI